MLKDYINKELIFLQWEVKNRKQLFSNLSQKLAVKGYVYDGFNSFLNAREDKFPTGLNLNNYTVAIPHGSPKYIRRSFVSIVTLNKSIRMCQMDNADHSIYVNTFFVLGLDNGTDHIKILQNIMLLIQQREFVTRISQAKTIQQVITVINNFDKEEKQ